MGAGRLSPRRIAVAAVALAVCASAAHADTPKADVPDTTGLERTYLERAAIAAADRACNLFTDGERLALQSGLYQTEGELLRAGRSPTEIRRLTAEVSTHAASLGCEHPSVLQVAATIRDSYRHFSRTTWIEYPTARSSWGASRSAHDAWAVMQPDKATGAMLGLRRDSKTKDLKLAIAVPAKGRAAASARLFMRDTARITDPWLGSLFGSSGAAGAPPRSLARGEWAGEFKRETDALGAPIHVFYFGASTLQRLEQLDPRETIEIELTPSEMARDAKPARYVFEVGDIRAAHAFVRIPAPTYAAAPTRATSGGQH